MSNEFADERADLAAVLRWAAREGMQEAAGNHCSLSVSENGNQFLINPDGKYFSNLKASDLLLINLDEHTSTKQANLSAWLCNSIIISGPEIPFG